VGNDRSPRRQLEKRVLSENKAEQGPANRRSEERYAPPPQCSAIVRISGIPVQQFKLKDVSRNGTCFLVDEDSAVLRNLAVGQEIEIQFPVADAQRPALFHRSEITHITRASRGAHAGQCLVGVRILSRLSIF
jgi:hypothetical protein